MSEQDERIKRAAAELAAALTAGGSDYSVSVHGVDVTAIDTAGQRWAYDVQVVEHNDRVVAP